MVVSRRPRYIARNGNSAKSGNVLWFVNMVSDILVNRRNCRGCSKLLLSPVKDNDQESYNVKDTFSPQGWATLTVNSVTDSLHCLRLVLYILAAGDVSDRQVYQWPTLLVLITMR